MTDNKPEGAPNEAPNLAEAIQDQALTQKLVENYEQAIERDGQAAYGHLGFALFHSISPERAQRELSKLGLKPKDALDHYNQGCARAAEEKFSQAADSFAAALKLNPELKEARFNLALAQEKNGDAAHAKKTWNELLGMLGEEEAAEIRAHLKEMA